MPFVEDGVDERLVLALEASRRWQRGEVKPGEPMRASVAAHAAARDYGAPLSVAVARAVGQAAGTAHFAEHSIGAALYALKAVKIAGRSVDGEREWQDRRIPGDLIEAVRECRSAKAKAFGL